MSNRLARRADRLADLPPAVDPEPPERPGRPNQRHRGKADIRKR